MCVVWNCNYGVCENWWCEGGASAEGASGVCETLWCAGGASGGGAGSNFVGMVQLSPLSPQLLQLAAGVENSSDNQQKVQHSPGNPTHAHNQ